MLGFLSMSRLACDSFIVDKQYSPPEAKEEAESLHFLTSQIKNVL